MLSAPPAELVKGCFKAISLILHSIHTLLVELGQFF